MIGRIALFSFNELSEPARELWLRASYEVFRHQMSCESRLFREGGLDFLVLDELIDEADRMVGRPLRPEGTVISDKDGTILFMEVNERR